MPEKPVESLVQAIPDRFPEIYCQGLRYLYGRGLSSGRPSDDESLGRTMLIEPALATSRRANVSG